MHMCIQLVNCSLYIVCVHVCSCFHRGSSWYRVAFSVTPVFVIQIDSNNNDAWSYQLKLLLLEADL